MTTAAMPGDCECLTRGQMWADVTAAYVGSWRFVGHFLTFLGLWIGLNMLIPEPWDPYPFILLNLILSFIAGFQAPIIMISQNRAAERDRAIWAKILELGEKQDRAEEKRQREVEAVLAEARMILTEARAIRADVRRLLLQARKGAGRR